MVVAGASNAAVLVTSVRTGSRRRLRRALALLDRAGTPYVGVVLNRAGKERVGIETAHREPKRAVPRASSCRRILIGQTRRQSSFRTRTELDELVPTAFTDRAVSRRRTLPEGHPAQCGTVRRWDEWHRPWCIRAAPSALWRRKCSSSDTGSEVGAIDSPALFVCWPTNFDRRRVRFRGAAMRAF